MTLSGQQHDLPASVTGGQLVEGVSDLRERIGACDRYLEPAIGNERDKLRQQWRTGDRVCPLPLDTQALHRVEIDDRVDPLA